MIFCFLLFLKCLNFHNARSIKIVGKKEKFVFTMICQQKLIKINIKPNIYQF